MKVCFIYESGFANNNGSNHLLCSVIEKMLDEGWDVTLIESLAVRDNPDYPIQLERENFHCFGIEMPVTSKTNFAKRYINGIVFAHKAKKIIKKLDFDCFYIQSYPTVLFTMMMARKFKKPVFHNIYDVFPGSAYDLKVIKSKFLDKAFRLLQKKVYKNSSLIFVMSDDMKTVLLKENVGVNKIVVVNSWYDNDSVRYISNEKNTFVTENDIDCSKVIVQFAGNIGQVFADKEYIELVKSMKDFKKVEFHLIGSGAKLDFVKDELKGCENIRFFGWQPQSRMSEIYSYCDYEIIPLHRGVIGNDVPSKIALVLSCGKPIINIVEHSHYFDMFLENEIGYSFQHNEINKVKDLLIQLVDEKQNHMNEKCVLFANSYFSKEINTKKMIDAISNYMENGINIEASIF